MSDPGKVGAEFVWQMCSFPAHHELKLTELLMEGWEPFAVTTDTAGCDHVYLRRLFQKHEVKP